MFGFIPNASDDDTFFYSSAGNSTANRHPIDYAVWTKPPNIRFIWMLIQAPGGAGGNGGSGAANRLGGGGGGGSGGAVSALFSAANFPDSLFISTGNPGTNNPANNSTHATISLSQPFNAVLNPGWQIMTVNAGSSGTSGNTAGVGGPAGSAGSLNLASSYFIQNCLYYQTVATPDGLAGGNDPTSPNNVTTFTTYMSPATGGGAYISAGIQNGGSVASPGISLIEYLWSAVSANTDGFVNRYLSPFSVIAGTGSGASATTTNKGGDGAYGSGGGGGGGSAGTAGAGGRGGNGFVVIKCW